MRKIRSIEDIALTKTFDDEGNEVFELQGSGGYMDENDDEQEGPVWFSFDEHDLETFNDMLREMFKRAQKRTKRNLINEIHLLTQRVWDKYKRSSKRSCGTRSSSRYISLGRHDGYEYHVYQRREGHFKTVVEFGYPYSENLEKLRVDDLEGFKKILVKVLKEGIKE